MLWSHDLIIYHLLTPCYINCTFTSNHLVLWSTALLSWTIWLLYGDQLHFYLEPSGYCSVINCTFTSNHLVLWSTALLSWIIWLLYSDQLFFHLETSGYCTVINCTFILNHLVTVQWSIALSLRTIRLLLCDQLSLYLLYNKCFWLVLWRYFSVQTLKILVPDLDYVVWSSWLFSIHIRR